MNNIKWIFRIWKNHKLFILLLFFLTLISTSVSVIYPYLFKYLLDKISEITSNPEIYSKPMGEIHNIVLIFLAVGLVNLISAFYPGARAYMNQLFEYKLRTKYFKMILEKDYKFFNLFRTGDLVTRLTSDLSDFPKICWFLCSGIFRAVESSSKILFCLGAMFLLNRQLTLLTILPLPIMIVVFYFTSNKLYINFKKNQEAISEINNQLEMSLSGVRIIKAFTSEFKYKRFFSQALDNRFRTEMNVVKLNTALHMIYEYIDYIAQIGVIVFGGIMVVNGDITIGTFYAFYAYLSMIIYPILDLPQLFVSGKQAFVNIERLEEIKDFPLEALNLNKKIKIEQIEKICFRNVSFSYSDSKNMVLNDVSFEVKKGQKVIIIGGIGSGKSTILGLLTGIFKPHKGTIEINDILLEDIDLVHLREKIGYVPQEPVLYSGTIRENILFGNDTFTEKIYNEILDMVQMKREVSQFIDNDQTQVGQRGLSLSGGQKQRLAIARALVRKPQVLIFDDITASLDADNEENLWKDIADKFGKITCFIVSHRLSTIKYVDSVIFMDSGSILATGKHKLIMKNHPVYKKFIEEHLYYNA